MNHQEGEDGLFPEIPVAPGSAASDAMRVIQIASSVDLSSTSPSKWDEFKIAANRLLGGRSGDWSRNVGATGVPSHKDLNKLSNRMKQSGVADVRTTFFVTRDPLVINSAVSALKAVIESPGTSTREAAVVLLEDTRPHVSNVVTSQPDNSPLQHHFPQAEVTVATSRFETNDAMAIDDARGPAVSAVDLVPDDVTCWAWLHSRQDRYADVPGQTYQYLRTTRAARDGVKTGDWAICHHEAPANAGRPVFGAGRVHRVHNQGEDRYAVFDRFVRLEPPLQWTDLANGDPRAQPQNPINRVPNEVVRDLLSGIGVARLEQIPVPPMALSVAGVQSAAGELRLDRGTIEAAVAALRAGKHLILTGPPGTGKSTLAIALARAAAQVGLSGEPIVTTGTADWTTADTVGGYRLDPDRGQYGGLSFVPGYLLDAVRGANWLVIDELNRADIDKSIGQFFSVLSGQTVVLPFVDDDGRKISVAAHGMPVPDGTVGTVVPEGWRLIATMNERDRDLLFTLSEAFMRRFALVRVAPPSNVESWAWILRNRAPVSDPRLKKRLEALTRLSKPEVGPALVIDAAAFVNQQLALVHETGLPVDDVAIMRSALDALIYPQLTALMHDDEAAAHKWLEQNVLAPEAKLKPPKGLTAAPTDSAEEGIEWNDPIRASPEDSES